MLGCFSRIGLLHQLSKQLLNSRNLSTFLRRTPHPQLLSNSKIQMMNLMTISQSLDESFNKHKIIPEVVDKFDTQGLLTIEYSDKDHVALGNTLKVEDTQERPIIQFTINSPGSEKELELTPRDRFTLVLTDPDAPSNTDHKWSEYAHWIVTDLQLNTEESATSTTSESDQALSLTTVLDYTKGNEILPYQGPAPPPGTGKHRYVFLLFRQDPTVRYEAPLGRPTWGTDIPGSGFRDWVKKHGGLLKLITLNFFYAQNVKQD